VLVLEDAGEPGVPEEEGYIISLQNHARLGHSVVLGEWRDRTVAMEESRIDALRPRLAAEAGPSQPSVK